MKFLDYYQVDEEDDNSPSGHVHGLLGGIVFASFIIGLILLLNQNSSVFVEAKYFANHQQGSMHIDFDGFYTAKEAVDRSDVICYGKVLQVKKPESIVIGMIPNTETGEDEPLKMLYTVAVIEVINGFKGDYREGDVLEIKQLGSDSYGYYVDPTTTKHCKDGNNYLLLLNDYDHIGEDIPLSPINPTQGVYLVVNDKVVRTSEDEIIVDGASIQRVLEELVALIE